LAFPPGRHKTCGCVLTGESDDKAPNYAGEKDADWHQGLF